MYFSYIFYEMEGGCENGALDVYALVLWAVAVACPQKLNIKVINKN